MKIERNNYLNKIIERKQNGMIKVITGVRRCGKSYLLLTGEVSAVSAAIEKAIAGAGGNGMFLDSSIIANPDDKLWETIL